MSKQKPLFLLVDDDDFVLSIFTDLCDDKGYNYVTAKNGVEAINLLKEHEIDVIISDFNMPKMNGIELLEEVRELGNLFPFILITGYGDKETYIKAHRLGVFDIIEKPFQHENLLSVWQNAVQTSLVMRENLDDLLKYFPNKTDDLEAMKSLQQIAKLKALAKKS